MKQLRFFALLFFFCAAIGCSRVDTPISGAEKRSIEAEVQTALDSLLAVWSSLDFRAVNRHYSDASIDTYNGDRSEPGDWAASDYDGLSETEIQPFEDLRFDVLARDAVVVSWVNTFVETDAPGQLRWRSASRARSRAPGIPKARSQVARSGLFATTLGTAEM